MGLFGIFLFVAFSKKAFIISLIALFLTYLDRFKKTEERIIHVHKINVLPHELHHHEPHHYEPHHHEPEDFSQEEEHIHYHWPYRKPYGEYQKNGMPYRNWKRERPYRRPYPVSKPQYAPQYPPPQYPSPQVNHPHRPTYSSHPYHYYHYSRPEPMRRDTLDDRHRLVNKTAETTDFEEHYPTESLEVENDIVQGSQELDQSL